MRDRLLSVVDLTVSFEVRDQRFVAPSAVSFSLNSGETLGLVGESGSGKSVTLRAIMGLEDVGRVTSGRVLFEGQDLAQVGDSVLQSVRGNRIGMVFQDPERALDPVLTIGTQLVEVLRVKRGLNRSEARAEAAELLQRVGVPSPDMRLRSFPHQLSGGLQQRAVIALAIACGPTLLLADEPTTALDVTIQDQILRVLARLREQDDMAMILVSHDLAVISQMCDTIAVMYAGQILECGPSTEVIDQPRHPYTEALLKSAGTAAAGIGRARFDAIPGQPPELAALPAGCPFAPRCAYADEDCSTKPVRLDAELPQHGTACRFPDRMAA